MKLKLMSYNIAGGRSFEFGPDYRPIIHGELTYAEKAALSEFYRLLEGGAVDG